LKLLSGRSREQREHLRSGSGTGGGGGVGSGSLGGAAPRVHTLADESETSR
jgi:hypothetical protein